MFDSFLQLAEDWAVHVDADALVEEGALDFLRAAIEALQRDASVSRENQVGLDAPKVRWGYTAGVIELTLPIEPSPILRRTSTLSWATLRRASASIPMMMIAPRRCCFGSGRSEPI